MEVKENVLIADDEKEWFDVIKSKLGDEYNFIYTETFRDISKKILAEKPNLIMIDSLYANENKHSIDIFVKSALEINTFILLFTRGNVTADKLTLLGARDYLKKPPHPQDIDINEVSKVIEKDILISKYEGLEQENQYLKDNVIGPLIDYVKKCSDQKTKDDNYNVTDGGNIDSFDDFCDEIKSNSEKGKIILKSWINILVKKALKENYNEK